MSSDKEMLERQAEDMYGRPTGPRHEELGARSRESDAPSPGTPRRPEEGNEPQRGEPEQE